MTDSTICVSIGRGRHKHMIAEHRHLAEQGAKLVELRVDYIRRTVNLKRLLKERPCPVIISCRRPEDGGKWEGTEEHRQILLRTAIAEGVEYVDLEEDIASLIPRFGKTQRIVSLHNFRETPSNLEAIHARLAGLDADIVKIATMSHNPHDNIRMLRLVRDSETPTVGLCMGDVGTPTRILAGRYGAPFTYATFHQERALAPGQLSFRQMEDIYRFETVNEDTKVFGVVADPVAHSLSPVIHNSTFAELGLNCIYLPFRVPREDLTLFLNDAQEIGIRGLSVTIPHKEAVLSHLTKIDEAAQAIGAVNTIVFDGDDRIGYNTDYRAAMDSLKQGMGLTGSGKWLTARTALVLGAGGASKAIAYGLHEAGADVTISSRRMEAASALATHIGCHAIDWDRRHGVHPDVVVNGTPVGMHPNVDDTPLLPEGLKRKTVVFDTIYNPERTLLIKQAKEQGCAVITGVDMFVRQAMMQFKLFTGEEPSMKFMRGVLKRATGAARI